MAKHSARVVVFILFIFTVIQPSANAANGLRSYATQAEIEHRISKSDYSGALAEINRLPIEKRTPQMTLSKVQVYILQAQI